jgi:hypothetical protein
VDAAELFAAVGAEHNANRVRTRLADLNDR